MPIGKENPTLGPVQYGMLNAAKRQRNFLSAITLMKAAIRSG